MNSPGNSGSKAGSTGQGPKKLKVMDIKKAINENKQKQIKEIEAKAPYDAMAEYYSKYYMPASNGFATYGMNYSKPADLQKNRSPLQLKSASFASKTTSDRNQAESHYNQDGYADYQNDNYSNSGNWNSRSQPTNYYQNSTESNASEASKYSIEKTYPYKDLPEYKSLAKIKESFSSMAKLHSFCPDWSGPAEFFAIRSSNDFDLHKAVKYGVWSSTKRNNPALQHAWQEMNKLNGKVFLFFTVVDDLDEYRGVAEMVSAVDTDVTFEYWYESKKFTGLFKLKWLYLQNLSYSLFDGINTYTGPVHLQRDGTRLSYQAGNQMLKIFDRESKAWVHKVEKNRGKLTPFELDPIGYPLPTSSGNGWLLDDFQFMDQHEKRMREERDVDMGTFQQSISSRNSLKSEVVHSASQGGHFSSGYDSSTHYTSKNPDSYNSAYKETPQISAPSSKPSPFQATPQPSTTSRAQPKKPTPESARKAPEQKPVSRFSKPSKGLFE